jgi:hypothetical protein
VSEGIMVFYAFSQSILIILSAIFDKGVNVLNLNHKIEGVFLDKRFSGNVNRLFVVFLILFVFYVLSTSNITNHHSLIVLLAILIGTPFNVFIMRWNTVNKREGYLLKQCFYGELFYIAIRSFFVILLSFFLSYTGLALAVLISPILVVVFLSYRSPVTGLRVFEWNELLDSTKNKRSLSSQAYILSVLVAVKNQILGVLIPLIKPELQATFVVISRIYGVVVILTSGISARLPYSVRLFTSGKKGYLAFCCGFIFLVFVLFVLTASFWLPPALLLFSVSGSVEIYTYILVLLVGLGLLFSLVSTIFQVFGRSSYALIFEVVYVSLFFIFVYSQ